MILMGGLVSLEIRADLLKYCILDEKGEHIDRFACPVEGCNYTTRLGPGAMRMHIIIKADPKYEERYDPQHEQYYREHQGELNLEAVRYLANIPRAEIGIA